MSRLVLDNLVPGQYDRAKVVEVIRQITGQLNGLSEGRITNRYASMTAAPTTGTYQIGDLVWNTNPTLSGGMLIYAWLCTVAGTPGTWTPLYVGSSLRPDAIIVACSDETTALTTGTAKVTFRMPYAFTVTDVKASLTTAQTSGSLLTVDVNDGGTTILSTKLTFDNTEKTTVTAATPRVISDTALAADAEITVDIDTVGDGTAKGLKVTLIGYAT